MDKVLIIVAEKLGVGVRRVQQLVKAGRLPAKVFGGSLMIEEKDLKGNVAKINLER